VRVKKKAATIYEAYNAATIFYFTLVTRSRTKKGRKREVELQLSRSTIPLRG